MTGSGVAPLEGLPGNVAAALSIFLAAARDALSADLVSAVVFGSAAEGQVGPASDVNLLLVLRAFAPDKIAQMRDAFLAAEAAIKLRATRRSGRRSSRFVPRSPACANPRQYFSILST
jgi:predicted nucleotidyltransferase